MTDQTLTIWIILIFIITTYVLALLILAAKKNALTRKQGSAAQQTRLDQAQQIISSAQAQAGKIISAANSFTEETNKQITTSLADISQKTNAQVDQICQTITTQASRELNTIVRHHHKRWEQVLKDYESLTRQQLDQLKRQLDHTITRELTNARADIKRYRQQEEHRLAQELKQQLPNLLKQLINRSIPTRIHEDIVREALAKLKQNNVLSS